MQLLGLLPVASKSAGKVTKNGQHASDGRAKQLSAVIASLDARSSQVALTNDPYAFHETEIKGKISDAVTDAAIKDAQLGKREQPVGERVRSIPIARLYPELAEKLEKPDSCGFKLLQVTDSSLLKTSVGVVGCLQSAINRNALASQSKVKERTRRIQSVRNNVTKLSKPVVPRLSASSTSAIQSCIGSTAAPSTSLQSASNHVRNGTHVVGTSFAGLSQWRLPANGQSLSTMPVNHLLSDALRGLLSTSSGTTNLTQQQSILRTLFPNLLSYASCGVGSSGVSPIHSDPAEIPGTNNKISESVESASLPPAPSLVEPSNFVAASASCAKEQCTTQEVRPSVQFMVRPKRLSKQSIERSLRRKIARHSSMKVCLDHLERLDYNYDILPFG